MNHGWEPRRARKKSRTGCSAITAIFLWTILILSLLPLLYPWYIAVMTGKKFKQTRRALKVSQSQLAKVLGVTVTAVARWERGERPISGPVALAMKLLLDKQTRGAR